MSKQDTFEGLVIPPREDGENDYLFMRCSDSVVTGSDWCLGTGRPCYKCICSHTNREVWVRWQRSLIQILIDAAYERGVNDGRKAERELCMSDTG